MLAATGCRDDREITEAEGEMAVVVQGNNQFALDLYKAVDGDGGNLFFSPFSINAALSMLYGGAEGDTEAQIAAALGVGDEDAWHDNLGALTRDLCGEHHRSYSLYSASQLWGQSGVPFLSSYEDLMADAYAAPLESWDFVSDPSGALDEINGWVEDETRGHIPDLFQPSDISSSTRLVMVNAIYFLADWATQFDEDDTISRTFRRGAGDDIAVPTMITTADLRYGSYEAVKVLEMPYEDEEISMVLVLPKEDDGLAAIEDALDAAELATWIEDTTEREVYVNLPSFELEHELPLMQALQALGITDAFDGNLADFTGQVAADDMDGNYAVNAARHKAYVKVDEQGTEAAAATGFGEMATSVGSGGAAFIADHPFLFLIRDRLTGTILFMGRIEDPSAG